MPDLLSGVKRYVENGFTIECNAMVEDTPMAEQFQYRPKKSWRVCFLLVEEVVLGQADCGCCYTPSYEEFFTDQTTAAMEKLAIESAKIRAAELIEAFQGVLK